MDDVARVLRILDSLRYTQDEFYIHCDGTLLLPIVAFCAPV